MRMTSHIHKLQYAKFQVVLRSSIYLGKLRHQLFLECAGIESGMSFLYFISFQKLYQSSNTAARPIMLGNLQDKNLQKL